MARLVAALFASSLCATGCSACRDGGPSNPSPSQGQAARGMPEIANVRVAGDAPTFSWDSVPRAVSYSVVSARQGEPPWIWIGPATTVAYGMQSPLPGFEDVAPRATRTLRPGPGYRFSVFAYDARGEVLAMSALHTIDASVGRRAARQAAPPPSPPAVAADPEIDALPRVDPDEYAAALAAIDRPATSPAAPGPTGPAGAGGMQLDSATTTTAQRLAVFLPAQLGSFTSSADAVAAGGSAMGMQVTNAVRSYRDGARELEIMIMGGPAVEASSGFLFGGQIPDVATATEVRRRFSLGRFRALLKWSSETSESEVAVLAGPYLVKATVRHAVSADDATAVARALDLEAITATR